MKILVKKQLFHTKLIFGKYNKSKNTVRAKYVTEREFDTYHIVKSSSVYRVEDGDILREFNVPGLFEQFDDMLSTINKVEKFLNSLNYKGRLDGDQRKIDYFISYSENNYTSNTKKYYMVVDNVHRTCSCFNMSKFGFNLYNMEHTFNVKGSYAEISMKDFQKFFGTDYKRFWTTIEKYNEAVTFLLEFVRVSLNLGIWYGLPKNISL